MPRQTNLSELSPVDGNELEGTLERIVFESPDSGFVVASLTTQKGESTTIVGLGLAVSPGETVRLKGQWEDSRNFGRQFRVESFTTIAPTSSDGIERYLASGLVSGVGKAYAKRLVDAFGTDTLRIIEEQPERLRDVSGIGRKRSERIVEGVAKRKGIQSVMVFLQGHGISSAHAVRIFKEYGDRAVAVLRDNPYRIADDISGIGFAGADAIAEQMGIDKMAQPRLEAGLQFALQQATMDGHLFLLEAELLERATELLSTPQETLNPALKQPAADGRVRIEEDRCYLHRYYAEEVGAAQHLQRILQAEADSLTVDVPKAIAWAERELSIGFSPDQCEAINQALTHKVLVLTGGPGTGKTTLLNAILAILRRKKVQALLAAPTGRAAKCMEESTGQPASTLHRLLEFSPQIGGFTRDELNPLDTDLVVVDECSMMDIQLLHALLRALPDETKLILVGDVDQLPSVGPGNVLMDILLSSVVPSIRLKHVFRQENTSAIVANAHRINRGEEPEWNTTDFFFIERHEPEAIRDTVVELVTKRIPGKFRFDPYREIQVLSPMHRGEGGVAALNEALQDTLNAAGKPIRSTRLRIGDKVLQLRNSYELDVFNGDVGRITLADDEAAEMHVEFEGHTVLYHYDDLDNLGLAYATTIHKAQGSEYPAVVIPIAMQHYMLLQRNVLYTAVTRARQLVILVGQPKAMNRALRNTEFTRRNTTLAERLRRGTKSL